MISITRYGMPRFCLSDKVSRTVVGDNLTFAGTTNSNKPFSITVKLSDANEWVNGGLIQECLPYLTAEQREILMTGNDNEAWEAMKKDEAILKILKVLKSAMMVMCNPNREEALTLAEEYGITAKDLIEAWREIALRV